METFSKGQWEKSTNKEKIALAKIRQYNKWWGNFKLYRNEDNDYVFSMEREAQDFLGYYKVYFTSSSGKSAFQLRLDMSKAVDEQGFVVDDNPNLLRLPACHLAFFYQVCEVLDGLLPGYNPAKEE